MLDVYSAHDLAPDRCDTYTVPVMLGANEAVTDPSSTHRLLYGPMLLVLRRYRDGGLDATVLGDDAPVMRFQRPAAIAAPIESR